jgi:hypothetical protein
LETKHGAKWPGQVVLSRNARKDFVCVYVYGTTSAQPSGWTPRPDMACTDTWETGSPIFSYYHVNPTLLPALIVAPTLFRACTQELCPTAHTAFRPDRHARMWETTWVPVTCPACECASWRRLPASGTHTVTHGGAPAAQQVTAAGGSHCNIYNTRFTFPTSI